jgi:hypothetical protein
MCQYNNEGNKLTSAQLVSVTSLIWQYVSTPRPIFRSVVSNTYKDYRLNSWTISTYKYQTYPDRGIYNYISVTRKKKRIWTTNPQHKEDLQTEIHKTCASHTHLLRQDMTVQELFNSLLTILTL